MRTFIRTGAVAALFLCPGIAHAQQPLGGWRGLEMGSLDTIYVTDDGGRRTEGKLLRLDTDSLMMLVDGKEQRFDAARVQRIDKRGDSLKNGALIGAAVGAVFGGIAAGISDCPGDDPGGDCAGFKAIGFASALGIYAAIGTAVDAMIVGRTRVFDAEQRRSARPVPDGPALALRVRW